MGILGAVLLGWWEGGEGRASGEREEWQIISHLSAMNEQRWERL